MDRGEQVSEHLDVLNARPHVLFLLLLLGLISLDAAPGVDLLRIAPRVPRSVAWQLTHASDPALAAFARRCGTQDLRAAVSGFDALESDDSPEGYERSFQQVEPAWARLTAALSNEFGLDAYDRDLAHRRTLSAIERWKLRLAGSELDSLARADTLDNERVLQRLFEIRDWCRERGHRRLLSYTELGLTARLGMQRQYAASLEHRRVALAVAREEHDHLFVCQSTGELAYLVVPESTSILLQEALQLSRRHGLVDQTSRLLGFLAAGARREGRLIDERRYRLEAIDVWDGVGSPGQKVRALCDQVEFYARMDCWAAVDELLDRTQPYVDMLWEAHRNLEALSYAVRVQRYRVESLIAEGRTEDALAQLAGVSDEDLRAMGSTRTIEWQLTSVRSLAAAGRTSRALTLARDARAQCARLGWGRWAGQFELEIADILVRSDGPDAAATAANSCTHAADLTPAERLRWSALRARAVAAMGDSAAAREQLVQSVDSLWSIAAGTDASPEAYLSLAEPRSLDRALHELLALTPVEDYRAEMMLRGWVQALGKGRSAAPGTEFHGPDPLSPPRLGPREVHVLFAFLGPHLVRWTARQGEVREDTLPGTPARWRDDVRELRRAFEARAGDALADQRLRERSRAIARTLLPRSVLEQPTLQRLYLSAAGPLTALPFEALDIGLASDYEPLASRVEVAMVRACAPRSRPSSRVVVVAAPAVSPQDRARYPELVPLAEATQEAETVGRLWPEARVLVGSNATKAAVLSAWRSAGVIDVAAHLVPVPQIPYYDFIPLAPDSGRSEAPLIEVTDVRRLDLSRCALVVLSTCASGVPYVANERVGPSMADAFLDAGAHAVLRTLRSVSDREARAFVETFLQEWRDDGGDAVAAAHAARIRLLRSSSGFGTPREWAAWSVAVNLPPAAPGAPRASLVAGTLDASRRGHLGSAATGTRTANRPQAP